MRLSKQGAFHYSMELNLAHINIKHAPMRRIAMKQYLSL